MGNCETNIEHPFPPAQEHIPVPMVEEECEGPNGAGETIGPEKLEPETVFLLDRPEEDYETLEAEICNDTLPPEEKAKALTDLLVKQVDRNLGIGDLSRVEHAITYGKVLLQIKAWVKQAKMEGGWSGYTKNFSPISERTLQNWTFIAKNPHYHRYAWMGEERLLKAARRAKVLGGDDPIGAFLKKEGISPIFLEGGRVSMTTKNQIDDAIAKPGPQKPRVPEVNKLADRLIERLSKGLEDDGVLAGVNLEKLETLEEKIKVAKERISGR
jgi:hypothetical protein